MSSKVVQNSRMVMDKIFASPQHEGDGAIVRRNVGRMDLKSLDPFISLDDFSVSPPGGFPDHPHRGFEAITLMLEGVFSNQDFLGNKVTLRPGDVQWVTAGRGIIHSEMPAGRGLQLWINLPSKDKMMKPKSQEIPSEKIKKAEKHGVEVRVIAGESMGVHSSSYTITPTMFLDFTLCPGAEVHQHIPEPWNSFVYVIDGEGYFGSLNSSPVMAHHVLVLAHGGDGIIVWNKSSNPLRFILAGGQPLNEPVVQHGPFIMNTQAEIDQTIQDYRSLTNGFEKGKTWESST